MKAYDKRLKCCPIKSCQGVAYYEESYEIPNIRMVTVRCSKCGMNVTKSQIILANNTRDIVDVVVEHWNNR